MPKVKNSPPPVALHPRNIADKANAQATAFITRLADEVPSFSKNIEAITGCSRATYYGWRSGRNIGKEALLMISMATGLSIDVMLAGRFEKVNTETVRRNIGRYMKKVKQAEASAAS